jgi:uncharacterized protein (DUF1697 family)
VATHAAFLRGINVGGRRASKEQLCACFAAEGFEDVATFRTSGNVVFTAKGAEAALIERCEHALKKALGFEVPVMLRTAAQVRAIARHEPFDVDGKVQVVLLPQKLGAQARKDLLALATDDDRLTVEGREVYWLPKNGRLTDSAIDMAGMSRAVGLNTIRTQGTMELIAGKYFAG